MHATQPTSRELANAVRFLAIDAVNKAKSGIRRIAIEAGHPDFWRKYVGLSGTVIGVDRFGESAPAAEVYDLLGVTTARLINAV